VNKRLPIHRSPHAILQYPQRRNYSQSGLPLPRVHPTRRESHPPTGRHLKLAPLPVQPPVQAGRERTAPKTSVHLARPARTQTHPLLQPNKEHYLQPPFRPFILPPRIPQSRHPYHRNPPSPPISKRLLAGRYLQDYAPLPPSTDHLSSVPARPTKSFMESMYIEYHTQQNSRKERLRRTVTQKTHYQYRV
jgi:hypothetical protein